MGKGNRLRRPLVMTRLPKNTWQSSAAPEDAFGEGVMRVAEAILPNKARTHTQYRVGNRRVPSVTTICALLDKPALKYWANKIGLQGYELDAFVDPLADVGTLAHRMIHDYLLGRATDSSEFPEPVIKSAEWSVLSFLAWEGEHLLEPFELELVLVSPTHMYGGTVDYYGRVDGQLTLIDFKSGSAIYDDHAIQVAAYRELLRENGREVESVRVLNIPRAENERFDEWELSEDELAAAWEIFLSLRRVYDLKKEVRRWKK